MVAGYHLIWTVYGRWLPNDPRGSSSQTIRVEAIADMGELHFGRKREQPSRNELNDFQESTQDVLKHQMLLFNDEEIARIAATFAQVIQKERYTCYACAIVPEHVHMLIRKHRDYAETMIEKMQKESRDALIQAGKRTITHPVWGGAGWKVFLNTRGDFERVIRYIQGNPVKSGMPEQRWPFVTEYDGWLPFQREM